MLVFPSCQYELEGAAWQRAKAYSFCKKVSRLSNKVKSDWLRQGFFLLLSLLDLSWLVDLAKGSKVPGFRVLVTGKGLVGIGLVEV